MRIRNPILLCLLLLLGACTLEQKVRMEYYVSHFPAWDFTVEQPEGHRPQPYTVALVIDRQLLNTRYDFSRSDLSEGEQKYELISTMWLGRGLAYAYAQWLDGHFQHLLLVADEAEAHRRGADILTRVDYLEGSFDTEFRGVVKSMTEGGSDCTAELALRFHFTRLASGENWQHDYRQAEKRFCYGGYSEIQRAVEPTLQGVFNQLAADLPQWQATRQ